MKTTRREFLATAAAAPLASPILLGMQDKAGTKAPVLGQGRFTYEALHDWGTLPPQIKYGNTHGVVQDSQGQIYVHHTVYADSESADSMVVFDGKGRFVRSWGRQFRGVAHGLLIRKEAGTEFLYLTVNATNPRLTPQPEMQAVVVKTTLAGEIVWKIQGPPQSTSTSRPPTASRALQSDEYRHRTQRRHLCRRRLRLVLCQSIHQQGRLHPHVWWKRIRARPPGRTARHLGRYTRGRARPGGRRPPQQPSATVHAGRHAYRFRPGFRLPCHFDEQNGTVVIPDLHGRVTLIDRNNQIIEHLGDSNAPEWNNPLRTQPRDKFIPGQFICPHGACFDHDGNIFVVEWVEVGRVTKLRKVA